MKISEIKAGASDVEVEGRVSSITEARDVQTKYGPNQVATAEITDDTGTIKLTLWGDTIKTVRSGDNVKLTGCFVKEYNDELQLTLTKNGSLKVL